MYVIVRCKLDEKVSTEAEFSPEDSPSVRVEGTLENEYTVSVKAPGEWPRADTECALCCLLKHCSSQAHLPNHLQPQALLAFQKAACALF